MAYEQRDNSGSLFRNEKREENPKAPNAKGKAMIGGVMYWVSAWTKEDRSGNKFQSLSFEVMQERGAPPPQRQAQPAAPRGNWETANPPPRPPVRTSERPPPQQPFGDAMEFKDADIPF